MNTEKKRKVPAVFPAPLAELAILVEQQQKQWRSLAASLASCCVPAVSGSGMVIDPYLLEHALPGFAKATAALPDNRPDIPALQSWVAGEKLRVAAQFDQRLREFCSQRGITFEGRYPSYMVADFILLEARPTTAECLVDNKKVRSLMFESVASALINALANDIGRDFSLGEFLELLLNACRRAAAVDGTFGLDQVPVRTVFREVIFLRQEANFFKNPVRNNYREYTLTAFGRDLSRLIAAGQLTTEASYKLNLGPTSTSDGVAIRFEGSARNIGRVGFVKEDR
jgi:hypothetical protein